MSLARKILEYGVSCCDPTKEGQINALDRVQKTLDRVQKKTPKFANRTNDSSLEGPA